VLWILEEHTTEINQTVHVHNSLSSQQLVTGHTSTLKRLPWPVQKHCVVYLRTVMYGIVGTLSYRAWHRHVPTERNCKNLTFLSPFGLKYIVHSIKTTSKSQCFMFENWWQTIPDDKIRLPKARVQNDGIISELITQRFSYRPVHQTWASTSVWGEAEGWQQTTWYRTDVKTTVLYHTNLSKQRGKLFAEWQKF